jgi:hypothetical protein
MTNCLLIVLMSLVSLPAPAATIGYWRFEDGDASAYGPELVAVGKPPTTRDLTQIAFPARIPSTGQTNARAIDFGSSQSSHLTRADEPAMRVRGLTVEALLLRARETDAPQYIASQWKYSGCNERSWAFGVAGQQPPTGVEPNELFLILSPNGVDTNIVASGLFAGVGTPYYAAASFSPNGVVTFYLRSCGSNAEASFTRVSTTVQELYDSTADFIIGGYDTGGRRWTGLLDEVRLSDAALEPEELLFNTGDWLARLTPPNLDPDGGIFDEQVEVKLASETPGALIRYTTDGSTPTEDSPLYTKPLTIAATATVSARAFEPGTAASDTVSAVFQIADWEYLGNVKPRHSQEITSSNWSVGAETMGRDYTIYANWRTYLGRLGVKKARVQSGWAKTEQEKGIYQWAWLDEIIPDMARQGVEPWVCLCYGNPIYPDGGRAAANSPLPSSPEALQAWDRFVGAFVQRYGEYVDEWEIWNEPHHQSITVESYAAFLIRTAETIRAKQPEARILAMSNAGVGREFTDKVLAVLQAQDKTQLVNEVTYHPYSKNPDSSYSSVLGMRADVSERAGHITLRQGENGCPSERSTKALGSHDWSELTQAKWALRRLLGDLGRDIPSSYFSIIDMHYAEDGINRKGLLFSNDDQTVGHEKQAYRAVQHLTAIFDDSFQRIEEYPYDQTGARHLSVFGYRHKTTGQQVVTVWFDDAIPSDANTCTPVNLTFSRGRFRDPVYVDLRTGVVRDIPEDHWKTTGDGCSFRDVPVYDSPILIAERARVMPSQ